MDGTAASSSTPRSSVGLSSSTLPSGALSSTRKPTAGTPLATQVANLDFNNSTSGVVNISNIGGLTIAVSENAYINQIAQRTVLSDDALSVLVPILESVVGWNSSRIREFFEAHGFALREWDKVQRDTLTICPLPALEASLAADA